jgi:hypothetical protein
MAEETATAVRTLADGNEMPLLGLGMWQVPNAAELEQVMGVASAPPVVNWFQLSPFEYRRKLMDDALGAMVPPVLASMP